MTPFIASVLQRLSRLQAQPYAAFKNWFFELGQFGEFRVLWLGNGGARQSVNTGRSNGRFGV